MHTTLVSYPNGRRRSKARIMGFYKRAPLTLFADLAHTMTWMGNAPKHGHVFVACNPEDADMQALWLLMEERTAFLSPLQTTWVGHDSSVSPRMRAAWKESNAIQVRRQSVALHVPTTCVDAFAPLTAHDRLRTRAWLAQCAAQAHPWAAVA